MTKGWTEERREAQRQRAIRLHHEGRFGGPGMGQGRKPKHRPDPSTCPHCGRALLDTQHDEEETLMDDDVTAKDSFVVLRDGTIRKLEDDHPRVALAEDTTALRRGQAVTVNGERGVITGLSKDRQHVYVRYGRHARKVDVDEVIPG